MLRLDVDTATGQPLGLMQVFDELEDPGRAIPKEVVALTGITDADVQGKRLDEARITAMLEGVDVVIAHNAGLTGRFAKRASRSFATWPGLVHSLTLIGKRKAAAPASWRHWRWS